MNEQRIARLRECLAGTLESSSLDIVDESHLHAGHAGAQDGRGHFRIRIVSSQFRGYGQVQRHRMVYRALRNLMSTDIHALSIQALTPEETNPPE